MIGIYIIENKLNGKVYIGQSTYIQSRITEHKNFAYNSKKDYYNSPLYVDIREFGMDSFAFGVIEECEIEDLDTREEYWITQYNSTDPEEGYNRRELKITPEILEAIVQDLESGEELLKDLAKKYDLHPSTVSQINNGVLYHLSSQTYPIRKAPEGTSSRNTGLCIDCGTPVRSAVTRCRKCYAFSLRKATRPNKETLLQQVAEQGFVATGRQYGVSDNAIRKWMIAYGLPSKTKEVKLLYGNHKEPPKRRQVYKNITIKKDKFEKTFLDTKEVALWLIEQEYTSTSEANVRQSVARAVTGKRKTYLGFTMTGELGEM